MDDGNFYTSYTQVLHAGRARRDRRAVGHTGMHRSRRWWAADFLGVIV